MKNTFVLFCIFILIKRNSFSHSYFFTVANEQTNSPCKGTKIAARLFVKLLFFISLVILSINFTVYINHRPAFGLDPMKLVKAFETLGLPTNKGNAIDRGDLLDLLQTKGMYHYSLKLFHR